MAKAVIINADDLGYDPAVSRGILEAMDRGVVSSATMMVNGPHAENAAALAKGRAIGLHFNLARWAPASVGFPAQFLTEGAFSEARVAELPAEVVEREALAQADKLESLLGQRPTHVDVHKHLHRNAAVLEGVLAAAAVRGLPVRALDAPMRDVVLRRGVKSTTAFVGDAGSQAYWTFARFRAAMEELGEGITEVMCHPGYAPVAVKSGYSAQREVELQTFTHEGARRLLERLGIARVDFRALE
jgi:predicted glycoside hydrolase/deacetylase ChbG (UPF0249 family)